MNRITLLLVFFFISSYSYSQTNVVNHFNRLKNIPQTEVIQLPDSVIVFPITGVVNILPKIGQTTKYTEIELWAIDAKGTIIYNNIIATVNSGDQVVDQEYCRYLRMQGQYERNHSNHN